MPAPVVLPKFLILLISVLQGVLLLALYLSIDARAWPSQSPVWAYPLFTLAIAIPTLFLLSLERGNERQLSLYLAGFALLLAPLAAYTGLQAEPVGVFPSYNLMYLYGFSIALACFKALMYLQQRVEQRPMTYQVLFTYSWRNFLVLALAAVFVIAFFIILKVWGGLFQLINIQFFNDTFRQEWFLFPVLSFAFGLGVVIFRDLTHILDNITRLLQGLIKLLLPLVLLIAVIFVAALPISGLEPLWATKNGSGLLMWLSAIVLFFSNAVYQDGRGDAPYPPWLHKLIYLSLAVLPILSALSIYGLTLRISQYGWTVERAWAVLVCLVLSLFSVGYIWGVIRKKSRWQETLATVNVYMGLCILILALLANSPLLDLRKISLESQLSRLESGDQDLENFDFLYIHRNLAKPGHLALESMKESWAVTAPEKVELMEKKLAGYNNRRMMSGDRFWKNLQRRPSDFDVPVELRQFISKNQHLLYIDNPTLIKADLNGDGEAEYALLGFHSGGGMQAVYFLKKSGLWRIKNLQVGSHFGREIIDENSIRSGEIRLESPEFKHLFIGKLKFIPR